MRKIDGIHSVREDRATHPDSKKVISVSLGELRVQLNNRNAKSITQSKSAFVA